MSRRVCIRMDTLVDDPRPDSRKRVPACFLLVLTLLASSREWHSGIVNFAEDEPEISRTPEGET